MRKGGSSLGSERLAGTSVLTRERLLYRERFLGEDVLIRN